jgi:cell division protease FtsH
MRERVRGMDWLGAAVMILLLGTLFWSWWGTVEPAEPVDWSELMDRIEDGEVASVQVGATEVEATLKGGEDQPVEAGEVRQPGPPGPPGEVDLQRQEAGEPKRIVAHRLPDLDDPRLLALLEEQGIPYRGQPAGYTLWPILIWVLPPLVLAILIGRSLRRLRAGGPLSIGKSRAQIFDRTATDRVTFEDVAGVDEAEAELQEVVSFLASPEKYRALGAQIPKGVLLVGPPGTGKTLLARAVAGEAEVPFFSLSGSDFVEMFVGVGAARIRDLFAQARERAPCIVFIDELDAVGRSRGGIAALGTNEEREQTLNQLLAEMDGFDPGAGVVIMAATNRPEILDPALVRPGRFDRQVLVDRPDLHGRAEILKVHLRKIVLGPDVDPEVIARRTPGMVGADLARLVNEAALAAARRQAKAVGQADFEEAIDRVQLGARKSGRLMTEEEKRRVAFHEAGHALVALSVEHADPVHKVSIIPRSIGALGVTLQLPTEERYLVTRDELVDRLCVMLGGRSAEEVVFPDVSTGAENDLERASEIARQMVTHWGMSETLGPVTWGRKESLRFLPGAVSEERNFSDETARAIDAEVRQIVEGQRQRAVGILRQRRRLLDAIAERLIERETLEVTDLEELMAAHGLEVPGPRAAS